MPLVATDALVLHVFDYLETSRILRLATREFGVQSVLARGARKSSSRFGSALDLFAEGVAQLDLRPGRDLQTLTGFEVTLVRPGLAADLPRFTAAAAISECVQRVVTEDHAPAAFEITRSALDTLAQVPDDGVLGTAVGALWRLVAELGFAPELEACAACHAAMAPDGPAPFSHSAGGVLCARCATRAPGARQLPAAARHALVDWLAGGAPTLSHGEGRAHQRLLREFLGEHLTDARSLKAYAVWEGGRWG
jgi:DNA repair protein RecO (recombination protein O)